MKDYDKNTEAGAVADICEAAPRTVGINRNEVLLVPEGMKPIPMKGFADELLARPQRRKGTASFADEKSFCEHALRFKSEHTAIFANEADLSVAAVLNYHDKGPEGEANWNDHRSAYQLRTSPDFNTWTSTKPMDQAAFAAFIEENGGFIVSPGDAPKMVGEMETRFDVKCGSAKEIREIARAFGIRSDENIDAKVRPDGSATVTFSIEHKQSDGRPLVVPGLFVIAIPIFDRAPLADLLAVRIRFGKSKPTDGSAPKILWRLDVVDADLARRAAFGAMVERLGQHTGAPVFLGTPER